jgi:hypothetical protein
MNKDKAEAAVPTKGAPNNDAAAIRQPADDPGPGPKARRSNASLGPAGGPAPGPASDDGVRTHAIDGDQPGARSTELRGAGDGEAGGDRPVESGAAVPPRRRSEADEGVAELQPGVRRDGAGGDEDDRPSFDDIQPSDEGPCPLCGSSGGWKTCGVRAVTGRCGRVDPRRLAEPAAEADDHVVAQLARMAPDSPMRPLWEGMLLVRRCQAYCRTTGRPCRSLPVRDALRCRMHGGRSTGPRPKHGYDTLEAQREKRLVTVCKRILRAYHPVPAPVDDSGIATAAIPHPIEIVPSRQRPRKSRR